MAEKPREVIVEREREPRSSVGTVVAVVAGIVIVILLLVYGLPYLAGGGNGPTTEVDVQAPTPAPAGTAE